MAETSIYLDEDLKDAVDRIAHERSSPGDTVSRSAVIQDAVEDYVDRHQTEAAASQPDGNHADA